MPACKSAKTSAPSSASAAHTMRLRQMGIAKVAPDESLANPHNWRIHPQYQQDALRGILDEVGWCRISSSISVPAMSWMAI
jgi:hypothetical protein